MKRRTFLQFLGLAPAAPVAARLPVPAVAAPVVAAVEPVVPDLACASIVEFSGVVCTVSYCDSSSFRFTHLDSLK